MLNNTQKQFVIKELELNGKISRNLCLRNYISRLGAIIYKLKQDGWDIEGRFIETDYGKDYWYFWQNYAKQGQTPQEEKSVVNIQKIFPASKAENYTRQMLI